MTAGVAFLTAVRQALGGKGARHPIGVFACIAVYYIKTKFLSTYPQPKIINHQLI